MPTFPLLKTGAPAQYPLDRSVRYATQAIRFLDGSQQRYRLYGAGLRRWSIPLNQLDAQELDAVISFAEVQGSVPFAFTDPLTGSPVANCVISGDQLDVQMTAETTAQTTLVIEELG